MAESLACSLIFASRDTTACQLCLLKASIAMVHVMIDQEMDRLLQERRQRDIGKN
jgi:hypothetical protein